MAEVSCGRSSFFLLSAFLSSPFFMFFVHSLTVSVFAQEPDLGRLFFVCDGNSFEGVCIDRGECLGVFVSACLFLFLSRWLMTCRCGRRSQGPQQM